MRRVSSFLVSLFASFGSSMMGGDTRPPKTDSQQPLRASNNPKWRHERGKRHRSQQIRANRRKAKRRA